MRAHLYIAEAARPAAVTPAADPTRLAALHLADAVENFLIYGSEEDPAALRALEAALDHARAALERGGPAVRAA